MNDSITRPIARAVPASHDKRLRAFAELGLGLPLQIRQAQDDAGAEDLQALDEVRDLERVTAGAAAEHLPVQDKLPEHGARHPLVREAFIEPDNVPEMDPDTEPSVPVWRSGLPLATTLDGLSEQVAACQACGLCKTRTRTVFAAGNAMADLAVVGEAPGAEEDRTGMPFVGNAGKLLDNMLGSLALRRDQHAYICNVLKCRPPDNRDPLPEEVARCEPYLQQQLAIVRPKIILVVGRFAAQSLLKTDASIASLRGKVHAYQVADRRIPVIVTYHPAYLLRNLADKSKAWADLCLLKGEMDRPA